MKVHEGITMHNSRLHSWACGRVHMIVGGYPKYEYMMVVEDQAKRKRRKETRKNLYMGRKMHLHHVLLVEHTRYRKVGWSGPIFGMICR